MDTVRGAETCMLLMLKEKTGAREDKDRRCSFTVFNSGCCSSNTDKIDYDEFYRTTQTLFGPEVKEHNIKAFFRKVSNNPDARTEWCEVRIFNIY